MAELVRQDARQFFVTDAVQKPGRDAHGRMVRIASSGKGIGLRIFDNADFRHGDLGGLAQLAHDMD